MKIKDWPKNKTNIYYYFFLISVKTVYVKAAVICQNITTVSCTCEGASECSIGS